MGSKILIPLDGNNVAFRFDLATEVVIAMLKDDGTVEQERTVVLPRASADDLCHIVLTEGIKVVVCGGIEDEYYQYLTWKRVLVLDSVIGPYKKVLRRLGQEALRAGDILFEPREIICDES